MVIMLTSFTRGCRHLSILFSSSSYGSGEMVTQFVTGLSILFSSSRVSAAIDMLHPIIIEATGYVLI
jgi:hypothetical protein